MRMESVLLILAWAGKLAMTVPPLLEQQRYGTLAFGAAVAVPVSVLFFFCWRKLEWDAAGMYRAGVLRLGRPAALLYEAAVLYAFADAAVFLYFAVRLIRAGAVSVADSVRTIVIRASGAGRMALGGAAGAAGSLSGGVAEAAGSLSGGAAEAAGSISGGAAGVFGASGLPGELLSLLLLALLLTGLLAAVLCSFLALRQLLLPLAPWKDDRRYLPWGISMVLAVLAAYGFRSPDAAIGYYVSLNWCILAPILFTGFLVLLLRAAKAK